MITKPIIVNPQIKTESLNFYLQIRHWLESVYLTSKYYYVFCYKINFICLLHRTMTLFYEPFQPSIEELSGLESETSIHLTYKEPQINYPCILLQNKLNLLLNGTMPSIVTGIVIILFISHFSKAIYRYIFF